MEATAGTDSYATPSDRPACPLPKVPIGRKASSSGQRLVSMLLVRLVELVAN